MPDRNLTTKLRAVRDPAPPPDLADRLERDIPGSFRRRERRWMTGRAFTMAKIGVTAAVIAALVWGGLTFLPGPVGTGVSLAATLDPVARATGSAPAVHIVMRVLSRQGEDISYVDLAGTPQTLEAWIEMPVEGAPGAGPASPRARITKGDRVYACDGRETITWHPPRGEAIRSEGCAVDLETFWPETWVRRFLAASSGRGAKVRGPIEEQGSARLVLGEPGVAVSGRAKAFLQEFDRETEVTWDPATHRLTGLRRWVFDNGRRLVAETVSIEYLDTADDAVFRLDLPADVRWVTLREAPEALASLGPRDVTRRFFEAAVAGDRDTLEALGASPHAAGAILQMGIAGIVALGEPFRTGAYPGVYVPYEIRGGRGSAGRTIRHNLALRDDNPQRRWVFDGGI